MSGSPYQLLPELAAEEYEALKADVAANGVLVPVELDEQGNPLDGHHRLRACRELGIVNYPTTVREGLSEAQKRAHVFRLNLLRRQLGPITWGRAFRSLCEERGVSLGQGARNDRTSATVAEVAEEFGVPERTARHRVKVAAELGGHPELALAVDRGDMSVHEARWRLNDRYRAALKAKPVLPPVGRFSTLVVDPPWPVGELSRYVRPQQVGFEYPSMTADELREFGAVIDGVAASDCHLYLWTTHKQLPLALELARSWGFNYECVLTWIKNGGMTPYSFMRTTELALFCHRGNLRLLKLGEPIHLEAPRTEHSAKPEAFFELIRRVSPGPRLELFARQPHEGFQAWGNEIEEPA